MIPSGAIIGHQRGVKNLHKLALGLIASAIAISGWLVVGISPSFATGVPANGVQRSSAPAIAMAKTSVRFGAADLVRVMRIPQETAVTWSVRTSNGVPALIPQHGNPTVFVAIAPGSYTVRAEVNGARLATQVVVYGEASGVTLTPSALALVNPSQMKDTISAHVVDSMGNIVADFNGTMTIHAVSGITYLQHGVSLTAKDGKVSVAVSDGLADFTVEDRSGSGVVVSITASALTSNNHRSLAKVPTYATTSITFPG